MTEPDIEVDQNGTAHIVYFDSRGEGGEYASYDKKDLIYAQNSSGAFEKKMIAASNGWFDSPDGYWERAVGMPKLTLNSDGKYRIGVAYNIGDKLGTWSNYYFYNVYFEEAVKISNEGMFVLLDMACDGINTYSLVKSSGNIEVIKDGEVISESAVAFDAKGAGVDCANNKVYYAAISDKTLKTYYNGAVNTKTLEAPLHSDQTKVVTCVNDMTQYVLYTDTNGSIHILDFDKDGNLGTDYMVTNVLTHSVNFDANGHGAAPEGIADVVDGSTISAPISPADVDYDFGGWYKDKKCLEENRWDFEHDVVNEDLVLYAKWIPHDFEMVYDDSGHWSKCKTCGVITEKEKHTGGTASCREMAECSVCKAKYGSLIPHNWIDVIDREATEDEIGSCHEECTLCHEKKNEGTEIPKLPHTHKIVKMESEEATCTKTGLTEGKKCSVCGEIIEAQTIVPKKAHSNITAIDVTKATILRDGKKVTISKCTVCGKVASMRTTPIYKASNIKLSSSTYIYSNTVKTPSVTVKNSKGTHLRKDIDYTLTFSKGHKNVGKYSAKVTLKGNYTGSKTLYFTVSPKATSLTKLTAIKNGFTATWKKQSPQITGYELMFATNKSFTKGKKTIRITSYKTTSKTVNNLVSKRRYYVKVRTYKTVNGTKYYSSWSGYRYVTTK